MSMTRKHFKGIAEVLNSHKDRMSPFEFESLVADFCHFFVTQNVNFNSSRFVEACGVTSEGNEDA